MATDHKQRATDLLVNYFKVVFTKAGIRWDPDYTAEIGGAVEEIVDAAVEAVKAVIVEERRKLVAELTKEWEL